jgi:hypothetical protein
MAFAYLIRIAKRKDRERAIEAFLQVRQSRQVFPDHRMLVTNEHIEVLRREEIPFEDLTELPSDNGQKQAGKTTSLPS